MEQLRNIEQCLVSTVQSQLGDLKKTNTKELGEVIDMIKDLEEAMYYCSIIDAMDKTKEKEEYSQPMNISYYMEGEHGVKHYTPYMEYAPYMMRDKQWREDHTGRSYYSRRMYMESRLNDNDDQKAMKELEHYMRDLGDDLTEMISHSTMEEKQVLSNKLQQLAQKIMK